MIAQREGPSPFIEGTTLQYAWDSTSLGLLKECPKKYEYAIIQGLRPHEESVHLTFGTEFHAALEHYDHLKADGATHQFAEERVLSTLLERTLGWNPEHSKKNRETLVRSVIWYLEHWKDDPAQTIILANGRPAVELSFQFPIDLLTPVGTHYLLTGHVDRLVTFQDDAFVLDRKTTGSTLSAYFFEQFNPHNQMTLYTLASRVVWQTPVRGVIIDGAQIAVGFTAFARGITMRSEDQLEEWLDDTHHWIKLAEHFASTHHYPRNEGSCHKYGGCPFRHVCDKSPAVRDNYIKTDFSSTTPWNPLQERGQE